MMGHLQKQQTVKKGVGRTLFRKTLWMVRGTSTALGLALMTALVIGVAAALASGPAEAAPASTLKAGVQNAVSAVTSMVGSVTGPILKLDNNGAGTALDLQVESGKAPMTVNSETKVDNLNADKVDGQDSSALVKSTYGKSSMTTIGDGIGSDRYASVNCDAGDFALSGGYGGANLDTHVYMSSPTSVGNNANGWEVWWTNTSTYDEIEVLVLCADVGTPHQQ